MGKTTKILPTKVPRTAIKPEVTAMLWGRSAGRCEFRGCNKILWKSPVTQERVNIAQRAHIYSFSGGGPRGHKGIAKEDLNNFENLILVCHGCHQKIDKHKDGGRYTVELLREWKSEHESRIELVTGIDPFRKSHVIFYGGNIGDQNIHFNYNDAATALFPSRYPAEDREIKLSLEGNIARDDTRRFYCVEAPNLIGAFETLVRPGIRNRRIQHASIFALAPQPLLILLGTLLNDIAESEVFQRHREPLQTWEWAEQGSELDFVIEEPTDFSQIPVLILALSDHVDEKRITEVLGESVAIWKITVKQPDMDLIKTRKQLSQVRNAVRRLLCEINRRHGLQSTLHIFPVMGVSSAVEVGRLRMPKASMPWQIYDQIHGRGFVPALTIPFSETI